jgi:superfamily II DNA or RNA helicase
VELTGGSFVSPGTKTARKFIKLFSELKEMISSSTGKFNALETVTDAIMTSNRTIIFTQTIAAADKACKTLIDNDIDTGVIDSSMNRKERENVLEKFSSGAYQCIVSPKILDEGVDVPEADLAIIMSSSKSKRQMIQRMGRVIRKKTDGRIARVIILYIKDTVEDPTSELKFGNSDTFVDIIEEVADDIRYFDSYDYAINDYSNEFDGE